MNQVIPEIYIRFKEKEMLAENGRLIYAFVRAFSDSGYAVTLHESEDFSELGPPGRLIYSVQGVNVSRSEPPHSERKLYLFDREEKTCASKPWKQKIQVKFNIFSSYKLFSLFKNEPLLFPYPMHPWNYGPNLDEDLKQARSMEKKFRIFFSGDTKGYKRNRITYPNRKMTRIEIIETIQREWKSKLVPISSEEQLAAALNGSYIHGCVIVDLEKVFVNDWLTNLGKADFFVCPPGYVMPMCHNSVEAMAVGAIPIINYPEWFNPTLEHMNNCIAFGDETDLVDKIRLALAMDKNTIQKIRRNTIEYYEEVLKPARFVEEVEARREKKLRTLMITDRCVARHAKKLRADSVLIQGTSASRKKAVRLGKGA